MDFALTLIVGGLVVWAVHSVATIYYTNRMREEEIQYYTVYPSLEKVNGEYFAYDHNMKFLAQGKTKEELIAALKLRLPNHNIILLRTEMYKVGW